MVNHCSLDQTTLISLGELDYIELNSDFDGKNVDWEFTQNMHRC